MQRFTPGFNAPACTRLLWGLALLGLLLLPSDYRAGADASHGHALMQLWIDASDGAVHHHHESRATVAPQGAAWDWLEPAVADPTERESRAVGEARPDVADHQDSTPVGGSVHLLIKTVALLILATARFVPPMAPGRLPQSQFTPVLLPPPRWTPLAG